MSAHKKLRTHWQILLGIVGFIVLVITPYAWMSNIKHDPSICEDPVNKIKCGNPNNKTVPNWTQLKEGYEKLWYVDPDFPPESGNSQFVDDVIASLSRLHTYGFIAILTLLLIGMHLDDKYLNPFLMWPLKVLSFYPVTALTAIIMSLVGTGNLMHLTVICFGIIPSMLIKMEHALEDFNHPERQLELVNKGFTLGASHIQMRWRIKFHILLPQILTIIKMSIIPAIGWVIFAETIEKGEEGFAMGWEMYEMARKLDISVVMWYVFAIGLYGFICYMITSYLTRVLCPWDTKPTIFNKLWRSLKKAILATASWKQFRTWVLDRTEKYTAPSHESESGVQNDVMLEIGDVHHQYGQNKVLHDINLRIVRGEINALVGPSGCGKSTLFNIILGTLRATLGSVKIHHPSYNQGEGEKVTGPGPDRGAVYQKYRLNPNLTVQENVMLGLRLKHQIWKFLFRPPRELGTYFRHADDAALLLKKLELDHVLESFPKDLSGGQQQRVSVAQALIMKPNILLLDEPFGALDEALREDAQRLLLTLREENVTVLIITHEINEAIFVGCRILGLSQYWNWAEQGFDSCPGATIIFDKVAPHFNPDDERDYTQFVPLKRAIKRFVYSEDELQRHDEYVTYWDRKRVDAQGASQ